MEDAEGRFIVTDLPAGRGRLVATADGYAGGANSFDVVAGRPTAEVEVRLPPLARLRIEVRAAHSGEPLPDAEIRYNWHYQVENAENLSGAGRTNEEGILEITSLPPGTLRVWVVREGYVRVGKHLEIVEGSSHETVLRLHRGGGVRGRVCGPIPPSSPRLVRLQAREPELVPPYTNTLEFTADSEGRFESWGIAPGAVGLLSIEEAGPVYLGLCDVREGEITDVDLLPIDRGRVRVHGRVDSGGRPIAGVTVAIRPEGFDGDTWTPRPNPCTTGDDGSYSIDSVHPGHAAIGVTLSSHPSYRSDRGWMDLDVPDRPQLRHDISVTTGGRIIGRAVRRTDGSPVGNARVWLERGGTSHGCSTPTDADGRFELVALDSDDYRVSIAISRDPWRRTAENLVPQTSRAVRLANANEVRIDFSLEEGGIVEVTFDGTATHEFGFGLVAFHLYPLENSRLLADGEISGYANEFFEARAAGIPPGRYFVSTRPYHISNHEEITVQAGIMKRVRLGLRPGRAVRFFATDHDGNELNDADFWLAIESGSTLLAIPQFARLESGRHEVTATHPEHEDTKTTIDVDDDTPEIIRIPMRRR